MAFQHRRELQGFDERERQDEVLLNAVAVDSSDEEDESHSAGEFPELNIESDSEDPGLCQGSVPARGDDSHGEKQTAFAAAQHVPGLSGPCPDNIGEHAPGLCQGSDPTREMDSHGDEHTASAAPQQVRCSSGLCPESNGEHDDDVATPKESQATRLVGKGRFCGAQDQTKNGKVRVRMQTDTFYDDYLHRGAAEPGPFGALVDTPLRSMSYYTYAMWVRVVEGDPDSLAWNQFAFAEHHSKYGAYVQELRPAPVVPFLHGFTMPTSEKDAETNACFKQVLLRPHCCPDKSQCRGVGATRGFCEPVHATRRHSKSAPEYSFVPCWKRYIAEQKTLAEQADAKLCTASMWPVLQDVTSLRQWWVPGAVQAGCVHEVLLPLLCGYAAHLSDNSLRGVWVRRQKCVRKVNASESGETARRMDIWHRQRQEDSMQCFRLALPHHISWALLRLAGHVQQDDGSVIGIAGSELEAARLREMFGEALQPIFTSSGNHDLQLSPFQFFALRHVEAAARLEYMAEARGRPRPDQLHPEAEHDDPYGDRGGVRDDTDAEFEDEEKLPGGDGEADEAAAGALDLDFDYRPLCPVQEDEMEDVVHRKCEAQRMARSKQPTAKKDLLSTFLKDHTNAYASVSRFRKTIRRSPNFNGHSADELRAAGARQKALIETRKEEVSRPVPQVRSQRSPSPKAARSRSLRPEDLPRSPMDVATELIAKSGVFRSQEQYLATIFMLQPCQEVWEAAVKNGCLSELQTPSTLARLSTGIRVRRLFLHGPGGSGKTYSLTEVVIKVVKQFFGSKGVLAIAAANSAARLLRGKTMHSAGKMTRQQSLKAHKLKPNSRAKKALQREWEALVFLLGDELSMASPPLLAGISRRASHGRKDLLKLDMSDVLTQPFGQVLLQALAGDFMQLNPVASHTLMEALLQRSHVPGDPSWP